MPRVTAVYKPGDYPGSADETTKTDLAALFAHLFPNAENPEIDKAHSGIAIAALNPKLALNLARISALIAGELPWCQRKDLRELAIQTLNQHFRCDYSFKTRMPIAESVGISRELQGALPEWKNSSLFNDEQRLVVEYTNAVVRGAVPDDLFARAVGKFGEKGVVEFTALVGFWSFWAMFLNATGPDLDPEA